MVTDNTGAVIPNAKITVKDVNKGTTQTTQSNASGNWRVDHLIPDVYDVAIEAPSFSQGESKSIDLHADTAQIVDVALTPAGSTQTVQVLATDTPTLKVDRADVAEVLNTRTISGLPNLNRNLTQFTLLTPGVQHSSFNIQGPENPQGAISVTTNGSSYGVQGWMLDGTDDREPVLGIVVINPTLDSVGELKVTSSNYDAEFGGAVGGIISAQTKSGTNDLHGGAFFSRHSDAQLARDPFTQSSRDAVTGRYIPSAVFGQFGGSLGGPIRKDKTFFFMDYQGTRQRVGTSQLLTVPTLQARNTCLFNTGTCDLSQYVGTGSIYARPVSGGASTRYANGRIPATALSPQAINLLKLLPAPNTNGTASQNNYQASGNGINDADQADIRLDHQLTDKTHLFARYDYALYRLFGGAAFGPGGGGGFGLTNTTGTAQVQNQNAAVGMDWALSPTLLTDLRFGFLSYHVSENKLSAGTAPAAAAGIPNLNATSDSSGLPTLNITDGSISNFGNQNCNCPLLESEQVFQLANNWTKIMGNHTFKAGGDIRYAMNLRNASDNNRSGVLTFSNSATAPDATSGDTTSTGLGLASLLLGQVSQFQRYDVYQQTAANRQKRGAFYAQDSWRATPKLTVNYGVRWDLIFPETVNGVGKGGFASLASGGVRVAGYNHIATNGNERMDYTNFAGRLGIAYQVRRNTVLRAAIGQVYDDVGFFGTLFGSVLTHNLPALTNENVGSTSAVGQYAYTLATMPARPGAPFIPANGIIPLSDSYSPQFRPERIQLPLVDQWNVTVQQQLSSNTTIELGYVGNHTERVYPGETYGYDLNAPTLPTSPAQLTNTSARRPYFKRFSSLYNGSTVVCCSNGLTSTAPAANANYHSLQAKLDKRFSHGLQFNANYTWSKAMNYANDELFRNYPNLSYSRNDTNRTNVFVLNGVYELPFGRDRMLFSHVNRWANYLIGGYSLTGNTTWASGRPFTPTYAECGSDQDIDNGFGSPGITSDCRPNRVVSSNPITHVGSLNPSTHSVGFFTPVAPLTTNGAVSGAFARPAFGTIGNIGRNSFVGPNDYYADISLIKDVPITERFRGQFQFQAYNVFNHPALDIPTAGNARCIDCTAGGVITSIESNSTMRQLQFAARLSF